MTGYLGIHGLGGIHANPLQHMKLYAQSYPTLGIRIGDGGHDAAAALVVDGKIVCAIEEERLNRMKHFMGFPMAAAKECAKAGGEADSTAFHASYSLNPTDAHLERRRQAIVRFAPDAAQAVDQDYQHVQKLVSAARDTWSQIKFMDHHLAHAASTFYCSGFDRSLVLIVDGQGESVATTVMLGDEKGLHPVKSYPVTGSFGLLYATLTNYLGFEAVEDEYKIMGLAAYGHAHDEYRAFFDEIMIPDEDGGFTVPSLLVAPAIKLLRDWAKKLGPPRMANQPIEERHISIAASLQKATERAMLRILEHHESKLKTRHLCLAGGVALNCSMNGIIDRTGMFDRLFVQPAAGDAGAALGAALQSYYADHKTAPRHRMEHVYLGPSFTKAEVRKALESFGDKITFTEPKDYIGEVAKMLADGKVFGWFQGKMEFGPRALGNRSILADPRRADMKDRVNGMVKKREEFRPFAPSTTAEGADAFFELRSRDQYETMTVAVKAKPERAAEIPAVVHVNGTARVHIVRKDVNPGYWELITRFGQLTQVPVVLNTSFNVKGEPIVCTPEDAIRCFLGTGIDHLAIEGFLVSKAA